VSYGYDLAGNRTHLVYPTGQAVTYTYGYNNPVKYQDPSGHVAVESTGGGGCGEVVDCMSGWHRGLNLRTIVEANGAYLHFQSDPEYFVALYLFDSNNDELMYLSQYAQYHERQDVSVMLGMWGDIGVRAAEEYANLEQQIQNGEIDLREGARQAITLLGIVAIGATMDQATNLSTAGQTLDRNGLTQAGRAFQKHGSRNPGLWGQPRGNVSALNVAGQAHLDEIVNSSDTVWVTRHHAMYGGILEGRLPDGRGARWSADGSHFYGFLDR
jgi:hypothetical protein